MGFHIFYAIPLQAGCTFSLFMQILDFKICVYFFSILFFYVVFLLLNQYLGAHSLCRCLVYTLQSHRKNHFHTLALQTGSLLFF